MISKELFEAVTNIKSDRLFYSSDGYVSTDMAGTENKINIYELAHKCKEWAFDNGYYLTIHNDAVDIILQTNCKLIENITDDSFKYSPMLVFKACQWILDNKED